MFTLEELQPKTALHGILPDALVTVVSVQWFGSADALELTYKTPTGKVANELLYRHDEPRLEVVEQGRPWSFDGDGGLFRLVSEAQRILDAETMPRPPLPSGGGDGDQGETKTGGGTITPPLPPPPPVAQLAKRFHGTVTLDPTRVGRDASRIADEVIAHLSGLVGAQVTVTLEIEAEIPSGASDQVVRTVTENSRTLKFTNQGFERE